ncbi:MAG: hypothetical protein U9R37_06035, partial [Campylobacterota bacterium]|nr:hypothetical protein [Campylobacterota bacterium]
MKDIIEQIFKNVKYWQNKKLLLQAIDPSYFTNKNIIIQLLGITSDFVSDYNQAKRDMWNHQIQKYNLGDDILKNVHPNLLKDFEFAKMAIAKYNRTYLFISKELQASRQLAIDTVSKEKEYNKDNNTNPPILQYMPDSFKIDHEIALMATTRNILNLEFATNLKRNKYFIIDIMNLLYDFELKQHILKLIDQNLLSDKRFVSRLGCFDNLCEKFHNDTEYVANAVRHDISILKKTKLFNESILKASLKSKDYYNDKEQALAIIF